MVRVRLSLGSGLHIGSGLGFLLIVEICSSRIKD